MLDFEVMKLASLDSPLAPNGRNLTGIRFGKLVVVEFYGRKVIPNGHFFPVWKCRCDCGNEKVISAGSLTSGITKSCGCLRRITHLIHGDASRSSGTHPIYNSWSAMKQRCQNPKDFDFSYYGGRGIAVCDRWNLYANFLQDMGPTWKRGLTIERKNNNGDYCPQNCHWVDRKEQARNRRSCRYAVLNGIKKCLSEWAKEVPISKSTIYERLAKGWSLEACLTVMPRKWKRKNANCR